MPGEKYPHIVLQIPPETNPFTSTSTRGAKKRIPVRNRQVHSAYLTSKLKQAWESAKSEQAVVHADRQGIYLEFKSDPNADLVTKSLENLQSKQIRLLNVRTETETTINEETGDEEELTTTYATVYVSNDKRSFFFKKLDDYAQKDTRFGKPSNADLVNSISGIRNAIVESFWQDPHEIIPGDESKWCEVWLSNNKDDVIKRFERLLEENEILSKIGLIRFPERTIKIVQLNRSQMELLISLSDDIAEYRLAKETSAFWMEMNNTEQAEWVKNLLDRVQVDSSSNVSVCILDTGANNGHPLLAPVLADEDCQTVKEEWGTHDHDKHGTLMAGLATYGDLIKCLKGNQAVDLRHCLESVKILPITGQTESELWGYMTAQGISLAELQAPERKRIFCMAVTATDTRDRGRPSSWSGEVDQLASGAVDDTRRLIIICAGNPKKTDQELASNYPGFQITESIHDPAQSWNALTVGGYTILDNIIDPTLNGYKPLAPRDGLSPYTTTSLTWENKWPIKPEIVMESGNIAQNTSGDATGCDELSLLSTFFKPEEKHFYPFNMTSAATAQAAWFAAQIQTVYPDYWPETIRALMVHSAEWPETLKRQFQKYDTKTKFKKLLRICGYGVPNLESALYSASNSLTLISQSTIQPFDRKENGSGYRTKDMHLYDLPWPKDALHALPDSAEVQMRITLSYFIEPGPGEIGWKDRYRYASHALRFDVKSPGELQSEFIKRINVASLEEDEKKPDTQSSSDYWVIGSQARNKGSIHSDIWTGNAAELADSNIIAVYPAVGWWRERNHLGKWNKQTRYSLIVSITTPEESIDIYTPVVTQIGIPIPV